jgi:hypothetical protein
MKQKGSVIKRACFISLVLFSISGLTVFVGCGSGGGGGGGGGDSSSSISYTGNTAPALVTDANAQELAVEAYLGGEVGTALVPLSVNRNSNTTVEKNISKPIFLPLLLKNAFELAELNSVVVTSTNAAIQTVRETINGSCGGTASYTLQVNDLTGEFNGTFTFSNYCDAGITISGGVTADGEINLTTDEIELLFMTFSNLSSEGITIQGDVSMDATAIPLVIEIDYLMKNNVSGIVYWTNNYMLLLTEGIDFVEIEVSGGSRFYDFDYGYVDINTADPFIVFDADEYPTSGVLVCVGENNTKARLTSVDNASFRVEADTDGDDNYETDLGVFLWADLTV